MAKFTMIPGTYAAGDSIPLGGTAPRCGPIYHVDGEPIILLKGGLCPARQAVYKVDVGVTLTSAGATPEQLELVQDGVRVSGGLISFDAAAAGEVETTSIPNEVTAIGAARIAVDAITAITVTEGVVVVHRVD